MNLINQSKTKSGFTLLEITIVVGIIGLLAVVIGINSIESGKQSRDAKRQADIKTLQAGIELYKNKYGRYPEGCNGAGSWSGQQGTIHACSGTNTQYIQGSVDIYDWDKDGDITERFSFAPDFIPVLPADKKLNGTDSGYVYTTNSNGTIYKLKAHRTVETKDIDYLNPLKACDVRVASTVGGSLVSGATDREVIGWCGRVFPSNNLPNSCNVTYDEWRKSYAVWGGFEPKRSSPVDTGNAVTSVVQDTTDVICK